MDAGTVSPFSSTTSPVAASNPFARTPQTGKSSPPAPAPTSSAESMHVDLRSTQVTLSSNSNLQFAVPSSLVSSPLYTAGMANQLQSLQTKYANDLLAPMGMGSGQGMDINKAELTLGGFAEQELATQIGADALQNSVVTFDNFSEQSSDTTSLTQTQTHIHATQDQGTGTTANETDLSQSTTVLRETSAMKLAGSGHITLANGQTIAFKAELDVSAAVTESDTVTDLAGSSGAQSASTASDTPAPANSATTSSATAPTASGTTSTGQALAALLKSLSPPPAPAAAPDPSTDTANVHNKKSHKKDDWTTMLSQYSNVMDVINSVKAAVDALQNSQLAAGTDKSNQTNNGTANGLTPDVAPT